jgi:multimeric flavodoxin WrbA
MPLVRKGQFQGKLERDAFRARFYGHYARPEYDKVREALAAVEAVAWDNYINARKPAGTTAAGPGYADPAYPLSDEWRALRERLLAAERVQKDPATPSRVLLVCGSDRNDGSCPGEMSKSWRLLRIAEDTLREQGIDTDMLDLSRLTSDYDLHIHPCKGCVATAMPLCHWPCSCYPNHSLNQTNDWMGEIYEQWVAAHGILILTPVYWYQAPSALKLMMDRLVCADGGNPDPTTTHGKDADQAKALELAGWSYPKHLAGRAYGLVVHGDVAGVESTRRNLSDWLDWMGLIESGAAARLDRYIGYYAPYADSHEALDRDTAVQAEVRHAALAVATAVARMRTGALERPDQHLQRPRPK